MLSIIQELQNFTKKLQLGFQKRSFGEKNSIFLLHIFLNI
jgi:hypothetical protein